MKVKDLLGDGYTIPVSTNEVIKAMMNKISKEIFYDNHFENKYDMITRDGVSIGGKVNEVFFLQQGQQSDMFAPVNNDIVSTTSNNLFDIQATSVFNENEIRRAVRNDLDLQDIYDRMLKSLRTSLLFSRRDKFINVLTNYMNENPVPYIEGTKLTDLASVTFQGFLIPSENYNVSGKVHQCFESDIVALCDYRKLGLALNEHETPFINWLRFNAIGEDGVPKNVNDVAKNPDMILFDRRALKILVNESRFSYFYNPNNLTYTITYTENINIVTNTTANVCAIKEIATKSEALKRAFILETPYSYYDLNQFIRYSEKGYKGSWLILESERANIQGLNIGDLIELSVKTSDRKNFRFTVTVDRVTQNEIGATSTGMYFYSDRIQLTKDIKDDPVEEKETKKE